MNYRDFWVLKAFLITKNPSGIDIIDVGFVRGITEPNEFLLSFNPLFTLFHIVMLSPNAIK